MNFLKKSINTLGNAVEINVLKVERASWAGKRDEHAKTLQKYDRLVEMKNVLLANIETMRNSQNELRKQFIHEDIDIDKYMQECVTLVQKCHILVDEKENPKGQSKDKAVEPNTSIMNGKDSLTKQCVSSYETLTEAIKSLQLAIAEIDKVTGIDKSFYEAKVKEYNEKVEEVSRKLDVVREKQFGKKEKEGSIASSSETAL